MGMPSCPAGGKGTTIRTNAVYKVRGMRNKRSSILAEQRFQLMLKRMKLEEAKEARDNAWAEEWGDDEKGSY